MLHKISKFCDKINSINKMAEDLRVLKYQTPKSKDRDLQIQSLIETIQADCLLVSQDKGDYEKHNYDYSGVDHGLDHGLYSSKKE